MCFEHIGFIHKYWTSWILTSILTLRLSFGINLKWTRFIFNLTRPKNCTLHTMALESTPLSHGRWVYSFHCWKSHSIALLLDLLRWFDVSTVTAAMRRCMRHRTQNVFVWRTIRRLCRIEGSNRDTKGTVLKLCHCKSVLLLIQRRAFVKNPCPTESRDKHFGDIGKSGCSRLCQTFAWNIMKLAAVKDFLNNLHWQDWLEKGQPIGKI